MALESWREIHHFPRYLVSDQGRVQTVRTGRVLVPSRNQHGHLKVNLMQDGVTHTRAINRLVAMQFLPEPEREDFISIIHLDGDKNDCGANNLAWRPRYFAIQYHLQFHDRLYRTSHVPIADEEGNVYRNIQEAVVRHGLLFRDVLISVHERTYVWPTYQQFRILSD